MTVQPAVPPRIGLVHAVIPAIAPIHAAFARHWPQARLANLTDDALPADLQADGAITDRIRARILRLAQNAADGADAVLFTCTAFDEAIDAAAAAVPVPLLKPNEAMFDAALAVGTRLGLLATFAPAVRPMEAALRARGRSAGLDVDVRSVCDPAAMDAARAGDVPLHDRLVVQAIAQLQDCDAILLAQFSTSTALHAAQAVSARPVLSAPDAAVQALRRRFG
jgi:Asp/Glu/hydantoin racemase